MASRGNTPFPQKQQIKWCCVQSDELLPVTYVTVSECVYAWLPMTWKLWTWKCVLDCACLLMSFITISVKVFGKQYVYLWHRWLCLRLCQTIRDSALMFYTETRVQALYATWWWKSGNTSLSHNIPESSWNTKTVQTNHSCLSCWLDKQSRTHIAVCSL